MHAYAWVCLRTYACPLLPTFNKIKSVFNFYIIMTIQILFTAELFTA